MPLTLPGEQIRATPIAKRGDGIAATVLDILTASPSRVTPPCAHFGTCGGCALQHADEATQTEFKRRLVRDALHRAGYTDAELPTLERTPPRSRRRIDLGLSRNAGRTRMGLHQRGSTLLAEVTDCTVLDPRLDALITPLRRLVSSIEGLKREGAVVLNLLTSGPDILLRTDQALSLADREEITGFAAANNVTRVSWLGSARGDEPELVCHLAPTTMHFAGGLQVTPPPGAFLQASDSGEAAILRAILAGLPEKLTAKGRIVELYAGSGSFTGALSEHAPVLAVEGDKAASAALRRASGGKRIEVQTRDLNRQILLASDLKRAAAIVLDPPHAGAGAQMPEIAASGAPRVIYVSCNPAALTRDAALLNARGYRLLACTAVDQFLYSARIESVSVFAL